LIQIKGGIGKGQYREISYRRPNGPKDIDSARMSLQAVMPVSQSSAPLSLFCLFMAGAAHDLGILALGLALARGAA